MPVVPVRRTQFVDDEEYTVEMCDDIMGRYDVMLYDSDSHVLVDIHKISSQLCEKLGLQYTVTFGFDETREVPFVFFEFVGGDQHLNDNRYPRDFDEIRELLISKGYYSRKVESIGWIFQRR